MRWLGVLVCAIAVFTPSLAHACLEGQQQTCTLPDGVCTGKQECGPNGQWLPCEGWGACDDGNPLTYADNICRPGLCQGTPIPFNVAIFDSLTKIEKSQSISSNPAGASLTAAGKEFEAFQIAVHAPAGYPPLTITASAVSGPGGFQIVPQVYREAFVHVTSQSSVDGTVGDWPDLLLPAVDDILHDPANEHAFPYPASGSTIDENIIAYVEYFVPPDAPAGTYTGSVTVNWYATTFPVTLVVAPFALPATSTLRSWYRMSAPLCVPDGLISGSKDCVDLALTYAYYALDHRIAVDPTEQAQPPASFNYVTTWDTTPSDPSRTSFVAAFSSYLNGSTPSWVKLQGPSRVPLAHIPSIRAQDSQPTCPIGSGCTRTRHIPIRRGLVAPSITCATSLRTAETAPRLSGRGFPSELRRQLLCRHRCSDWSRPRIKRQPAASGVGTGRR